MASVPLPVISMNPNYRVSLSGSDELGNNIDIVCALPENFVLHVDTYWQSLMGNNNILQGIASALPGAFGNIVNSAAKGLASGTGFSGQVQSLSLLQWVSSSPIELNIPFQFNAISDAEAEIIEPVKKLIKLTLPSISNDSVSGVVNDFLTYLGANSSSNSNANILIAPGPYLSPNSKYDLTLAIGRRLRFSKVIVKNVTATMDSLLNSNGDFMSAQVDVTISTSLIASKTDIDTIFGGSSSNNTGISLNNSPPDNVNAAGNNDATSTDNAFYNPNNPKSGLS